MRSEKQNEPQTRYRVVTTMPWGAIEEIGSTTDMAQAFRWAHQRHKRDRCAVWVVSSETGGTIFSVGKISGKRRKVAGGAA